jgi:DNA-binding Xre family transcriptional regulator
MIGLSAGDVSRRVQGTPGHAGQLSTSTIRRIINGKQKTATRSTLALLAKALEIEPAKLMPYADRTKRHPA